MTQSLHLCTRADLPAEGQAKEFSVGDIVLCVALINGKPLAINNVCPHRGGPLAEGTVEGGKVVCPWHQWEFDLATGTGGEGSDVAAYTLNVSGLDVLVEL